MSENFAANPNNLTVGADLPHVSRYLIARGFVRPDEVVVDAACAYGYGSYLLSEVASRVISLDYQDVFQRLYWADPKIEFTKFNLETEEEFPKCDTWVSIETIEHLYNPEKYLDKVTKATKRCIVMSSPDKETVAEHEFHHSDVLLVNFEKLMEKYKKDWQLYTAFNHGYTWIACYVRKESKWTRLRPDEK